MFELFTDRAKRSIVVAQDQALHLGHDFIGTEHVLLGLADTDDTARQILHEHGVDVPRAREQTLRLLEAAGVVATGGKAAKGSLSVLGIDIDEIQRRADANFGPGAFRFPRPAFTPHAKKALEYTLRESRALGHDHIGTAHLLLGLIAEGEGVALKVLAALDVDIAVLRAAVLARIAERTP